MAKDTGKVTEKTATSQLLTRKVLLTCGILSSLLYSVMVTLIGPMLWDGYSVSSQWVSELFAFGAPSRAVFVPLGLVYQVLMTAFGIGVLLTADKDRAMRVAGGLLTAYGVVGLSAPFFAMHTRDYLERYGGTPTDTMHQVLTGVTVLLMMLAIGFGAAALGKRFRIYSIATIVVLLVFGGLTVPSASRIDKGLPTPWAGVVERISIFIFIIWVVVLALILLREAIGQDHDETGVSTQ